MEKGQLKYYNLSEFDKVKDFRLQQMDGARIVRGYLPSVFLSEDRNKLFLYNEVSNDIYHYDPELDSIVHQTLPCDLLPPEKKNPSSTKAESQDQMNTLLMDYKEDINFSKLVWDEASNLFYRFSMGLVCVSIVENFLEIGAVIINFAAFHSAQAPLAP